MVSKNTHSKQGVTCNRQIPLLYIKNVNKIKGFVGVTFNSCSEFGFKDWSSSKYQNPIP